MAENDESVENEGLQKVTEELVESLSATVRKALEGCTYEPSGQCAAIFEASLVSALRVAVAMGCPWQEAIWALRHTLAYIEQAHVEALKEQMIAKVGAPKPGEAATVAGAAEQALEKPLIQVASEYTPRSE